MIDLRSDTLTKPTAEMRTVMAAAPVGDDVFGEDPTVRKLEERVAEIVGKAAALFVPTGTMGNQIGVRMHCQPGDEFLCDAECHIYHYEQGASAQLFGVAAHPIVTPDGLVTIAHLEDHIRPDNVHFARSRLVCLENTHNRQGGRILPLDEIKSVCEYAAARGLATHLDGARLWNAVVATGIDAETWCAPFDTVSVCFSKGLGAPVGSALCGPKETIVRARRLRKALGGGWRQAGILAAGALYALEHQLDRLAEDHAHAQLIAAAVRAAPHLSLVGDRCDTNLVVMEVAPNFGSAVEFVAQLKAQGVLCNAISNRRCRMVTHLGVSRQEAQQVAAVLVG